MKINTKFALFAGVVIALVVGASYANSLNGPFLFDDHKNIQANREIRIDRIDLESLKQAAKPNPTPRPFAYISFALNYYFTGLNVWWIHLTNVIIHLANGILVYFLAIVVLQKILELERDNELAFGNETSESGYQNQVLIASLAAALFFVAHPVQTQSVTYMVQRMSSLCTSFYLLGVFAYLFARNASGLVTRVAWCVGVLVCWILALGTKQLAVTLPLAILLIEWLVFRKGERNWLAKSSIYLLLIVLMMAIVGFVFKGPELPKLLTRGYTRRNFTLAERLMTEGRIMIHYVSLILAPFPSRLTLVYDYPISKSLFDPITTILSWLTIFSAIFFACWNAARFRLVAFAILWFFLHLAVESTFIPLELIYEHRLYLPLVGVVMLFGGIVLELAKINKIAAYSMVAIVSILLGAGTFVRNNDWRSGIAMWTDNVSKQPGEFRSHHSLGRFLVVDGKYEEAIQSISRSLEIEPKNQYAYLHRGNAYEANKQFNEAMRDYNFGLSMDEDDVVGHRCYADLLESRGRFLYMAKLYDASIKDLSESIELQPKRAKLYALRGQSYVAKNQIANAKKDFQKSIELNPRLFESHNNFAWLLAAHPNDDVADANRAIELATIACDLTKWKNPNGLSTLAASHARANDFESAIDIQKKCLPLAATDEDAKRYAERLKLYESGRPYLINMASE